MLNHWLPVLIWAGGIFLASTSRFATSKTSGRFLALASKLFPSVSDARLLGVYIRLRKMGHCAGYFVLALLVARAMSYQFPYSSEIAQLSATLGLVSLYAILDEYHQTHVPNRQGSISDVLLDISGALIAVVLMLRC